MKKIILNNEKETFGLGKKIASKLNSGCVFALIGDLGSGKTVFSKGMASGLGIKRTITSPTFVLMKVYPVKKRGVSNFIHVDAYRLRSKEDLLAIGLGDYLNDKESVVVIEWADKVKDILPKGTKFYYFENTSLNHRKIRGI